MHWIRHLNTLRIGILLGCLAIGFGLSQYQQSAAPPPSATATPTLSAADLAPTLLPTQPPTTEWRRVQAGVEFRTISVAGGTVAALRLDPSRIAVRVAYQPQTPLTISAWMQTRQPLAVINGGYFEANQEASALTIADGKSTGESYTGFGGMLAVTADGAIALCSLVDEPYNPQETLRQAIQSFPRLVWDGQALTLPNDNGQRARRSVVAIDAAGQLLLLITDAPLWTLSELATWLGDSDLAIDRALNLDGGPSTGLAVGSATLDVLYDSATPVPQVVLIEPR